MDVELGTVFWYESASLAGFLYVASVRLGEFAFAPFFLLSPALPSKSTGGASSAVVDFNYTALPTDRCSSFGVDRGKDVPEEI